jgi:hypothetical protein
VASAARQAEITHAAQMLQSDNCLKGHMMAQCMPWMMTSNYPSSCGADTVEKKFLKEKEAKGHTRSTNVAIRELFEGAHDGQMYAMDDDEQLSMINSTGKAFF